MNRLTLFISLTEPDECQHRGSFTGEEFNGSHGSTAGRHSHIFVVPIAVLQDGDVWSTRWQFSGTPIVWE